MSVAEQSIAGAEARGHGFLASSVGRKVIMAATGVVLFGFVTVHMIGNTQAYMGAKSLNGYAEFLHSMLHGAGIWIFRAVLLAASGLHAWAAISLTLDNQAARPVGYRETQSVASTWSSRTMRWSGFILVVFIVYHLLHLTTGQAGADHDDPVLPLVSWIHQFGIELVLLPLLLDRAVWDMGIEFHDGLPGISECSR